MPSFDTERLLLRQRSMTDFDACLEMDRDPEVTKYIPGPWSDPVVHERFFIERIERSFGQGLGYWSILPKEQPTQFVGWVMLIPYDGVGPETEIGWRLNRFSWGKGYATEAALPIVRYAFETLGIARIMADIDARNVGSMRVAEKIGMKFVGDGKHDGALKGSYLMTIADYCCATMRD